MPRDTKRLETLLAQTEQHIALVREEMASGFDIGHVRQDLQRHAHEYKVRLADLREWNAREAAAVKSDVPEKANSETK